MCTRAQYEQFFRENDSSGDGVLSKDEAYKFLGPKLKFDSEQMEAFFRAADLSNDGKVTMEEFLTAMDVLPEVDHKKASFRRAFNEFDRDGTGNIDCAELRQVLGSSFSDCSDAQMERVRKTYDLDGDGKVNFEEFIKAYFES